VETHSRWLQEDAKWEEVFAWSLKKLPTIPVILMMKSVVIEMGMKWLVCVAFWLESKLG
jgi:hypothetical protein